ncbi:tricorn protease domain 2-containing protein [Piedraia hortae CBS 480.64]|uniref:Mitochondrial division protein 1 n=1 Tax=Piedraia hortae CBS 480.64 TaxID=1314780 RepID=A0A6A7C1M2_9PEZI|nr:tricorn protease domain 2-containing protein [Piedraia hortae CBS 480.64]
MRELARNFKEKGKSPTSRLPISTSQASASATQPLQFSQPYNALIPVSAPVLVPRVPFRDISQLRLDALVSLPPDDHKLVEDLLGPNSDFSRDAARILALRGRNQAKKPDQYIIGMKKISCQIMQFATVFDVATNAQAEVLSLPWAGIRSLLMMAQRAHEQSESVLKGIETALDTSYLLDTYFNTYSKLNGTPSIGLLYDNVVKLYGLILKFLAHAHNASDMNRLERVVHSLTDDVLPKFRAEHDAMLKIVQSYAGAVNLEVSGRQRVWVTKQLELLRKDQENINKGVKGVQQTLDLSALPSVDGAAYNSIDYRNRNQIGESQLCLHGTRVQIRQTILNWATTANDQRVFWLSGKAGTGKSTIARTVAHELAKQGYLVGSFFFRRGRGDLDRVRYLLPTIARQMAESIPSISHEIAAAIHGVPPVDERPLTSQFDALIKDPLSGYNTGHATDVRVIVIDALDECEDWGAIGNVMSLWPKLAAHTSMNLRVFVTSRSDHKVGDKLSRLEPSGLQREKLENLQTSTIKQDLTLFCNDELRKLREESKSILSHDALEDGWPGEIVVNKLVDICQPLFIAASTIFRDVSSNPRQRLQRWVDRLNFCDADALSVIYSDILEQAADLDKEWLSWFNKVIKPIALLQSPLTISALTDLLGGGDPMLVTNALKPLSSVIDFPSGKEVKAGSWATVRIYHESFRDFLMGSNLKGKSSFWTDEAKTHGVLLGKCIALLKHKLGRNVCKQNDPAAEQYSLPPEHVGRFIPMAVQYACHNWVNHASHSKHKIEDDGQVDRFLRTCFLFWIEAMAWLDKVGEVLLSLRQLQKYIEAKCSSAVRSFVADALRWVPAHREIISDTPLQTYLSALAFAPSNSVVKTSVDHVIDDFLQVWSPITSDWGPILQKVGLLEGENTMGNQIRSIALSTDGTKLVTTVDDGTVRLINVESGTEEDCKEIKICSVASLISGQNLATIAGLDGSLWKWKLGEELRKFDSKLPGVAKCASVSPDGRVAAWGLDDGKIYLLHVENNIGEVIRGHSSSVLCMRFLSDNETLLSGSTEIWRWCTKAGHERVCEVGTNIHDITISPDGNTIAWSAEQIISVFHCDTHEVDQIKYKGRSPSFTITPDSQKILISYHTSPYGPRILLCDLRTKLKPIELYLDLQELGNMTFSHDGKTIWVGRFGESLTQLDANLVMKSRQQSTGKAAIALSTDGQSLASLSHDHQLKLWSTETKVCKQRLSDKRLLKVAGPQDSVILISSDSRFVVVADLDSLSSAVFMWNLEKNELRELEHRAQRVSALAISPDNKTLLCGFRNGYIWTMDLESGERLKSFTGNTMRIKHIAFSPTGQDFASVSADSTIRIWSPESQTPLIFGDLAFPDTAAFSAGGRMLYSAGPRHIFEWDIEKACKVRALRLEDPQGGGLVLVNGRFMPSAFLPFLGRSEANDVDSISENQEIWAVDWQRWIKIDGRNMLIFADPLKRRGWISCGRTMVFPNDETGFTVLNFTGKTSF